MWLSPCTWAKVPLLLSHSIPVIHLSVFSPFYKGSTRVKASLPACSVDSEGIVGKAGSAPEHWEGSAIIWMLGDRTPQPHVPKGVLCEAVKPLGGRA